MQPVYVNEGPFWDKHPDVYGCVTRYIDTDERGNIVECWERNDEGVMVDVTAREKAKLELEKARKEYEKYTGVYSEEGYDEDEEQMQVYREDS